MLNAIRWIAVLPGALLAGVLAGVLLRAGNMLAATAYIDTDSFIFRVWMTGVSDAAFAVAGVYVGTKIAPARKLSTSRVLAIGIAGLALIMAGVFLHSGEWWRAYGSVATVVGAAFMLVEPPDSITDGPRGL